MIEVLREFRGRGRPVWPTGDRAGCIYDEEAAAGGLLQSWA